MPRFRTVVFAVAFVAIGAGSATAQTTYDACYVPTVGAIYLIKQAGLPTACLAQSHVAFSWTSGGTVADGSITLAKLAFDPATQAELNTVLAQLAATGTINASANPVDWTQLKNVPAGFADGMDAAGIGTSDHGGLTGLTDDDHTQYLLTDGVRNATNGFAVTGTFGTGAIPTTGNAVRLMWYPRKGAFRAGAPLLGGWNDASVGDYSVALGGGPTASGAYSTAIGNGAMASGAQSIALGRLTAASGDTSTALGFNTTASGTGATAIGAGSRAIGERATAIGVNSLASGPLATAMGVDNVASGFIATALGSGTTADGAFATSIGASTTASGAQSIAMGNGSTATGNSTTAMGQVTTAQAYASLAIGRYNVIAGTTTSWVPTDPLLVAGNGSSAAAPLNALTLLKNGDLTIAGTLTQSSDIRFKEGIRTMAHALEGVLDLRPIYYRFREGTGHPTDEQIGLAAQEVERVFPQLVHQDSQGKLSVAYTQLAAVLVRALQEQQQMIEALRAEVAALRATR